MDSWNLKNFTKPSLVAICSKSVVFSTKRFPLAAICMQQRLTLKAHSFLLVGP